LQVELLLRLNLIEARRPRPWGLASFGRRPLEPLPHRHPLQVCKHASTGCLERAPSAHPSCGWLARRNWQACYMRARKNRRPRPHDKYEVKAVQGELSGHQQALRACVRAPCLALHLLLCTISRVPVYIPCASCGLRRHVMSRHQSLTGSGICWCAHLSQSNYLLRSVRAHGWTFVAMFISIKPGLRLIAIARAS
jgi:hypothetical protein